MSQPEPPCPTPVPVTPPLFVECVIVCDKYADFLQQTLPHNKYLYDRIVVVTSYEDRETRRICEYNHVECIPTDVLESRKGVFKKGAGINVGLEALSLGGFVAHVDADIYLPPQARLILQRADLDPSMVYGIDRFMVRGMRKWLEFTERPRLLHEDETWIHMESGFPVGTRVMHYHQHGWLPIGFFQLWNPVGSGVFRYPEGHTDAGREDTLFAGKWPRRKRGFIPELVGYHLESDDAQKASNWSGRTTSPFTFKTDGAK
jgi:hypothetical protein